MAHQVLKPYSLLLYLLSFITFFFVGASIAGLIGVAKNQGLAGGAIVFGYAVIAAFIALIVAIVIASKISRNLIINLNKILAILIVVFFSYFVISYQARQKEKEKTKIEHPKKKTTKPVNNNKPIAMLFDKGVLKRNTITIKTEITQTSESKMGIGFFKPNYFEYPTLYFYGNISLEKSILEHTPIDSLVFAKNKYNTTTSYAPPWLFPEHLKLDYGIIIFKVLGLGEDFVKVEVNHQTKQTMYLDKYKGTFTTWPEFIFSVSSIEFNENSSKKVFVKPLDHAGEVKVKFVFMQPLMVEEDWMYVKLVDGSLKKQSKGWILWRENGKLLIRYSLLS